MSSESEARAAIAELDGYSLNGSRIHVEVGVSEWIDWLSMFVIMTLVTIIVCLLALHCTSLYEGCLLLKVTALDNA